MRNRVEFVKKIMEEMIKNKPRNIEHDDITPFIEDILRYSEGETKEEYETNQHHVRIQNLFRGHVAKTYIGTNFDNKQCRI